MKIQYYTKEVYGNPQTYAADPVMQQKIAALTHCKTLRASDIAALEALGFTFEQVFAPAKRAA